jgi:hypothetical protein
VDHGYIEYTNLLFSAATLLAVYFFYLAMTMKGKTSYLILSAIFFSIMALTRSEGIIYVFLFIILDMIFFIKGLVIRKRFSKNLLNLLMPTAVFLIFLVPWYLLRLKLDLPLISTEWELLLSGNTPAGGAFDVARAASVMSRQFILSIYDSTRAVFGSFYGPIWVLMLVAMLFNLKRHFRDYNWIFFAFISLGMITIFISIASIADFANSSERYILHLFPVSYYWIMTNSIGKQLQERMNKDR